MRAAFIGDTPVSQDRFILPKEYTHYFLNVLRLKVSQKVLLLNGKGKRYLSQIEELTKKQIILKVLNEDFLPEPNRSFDIAFGLVKKDSLESCLRSCTELGAKNIYILKSDYSQSYNLNDERVEKILISSCEQSNRAYVPNFSIISLEEILSQNYDSIYWGKMSASAPNLSGKAQKILMLVGPEGGFSDLEVESISGSSNSIGVNLGMNILRTKTVIPSIIGYVKAVENLDA